MVSKNSVFLSARVSSVHFFKASFENVNAKPHFKASVGLYQRIFIKSNIVEETTWGAYECTRVVKTDHRLSC